MVQQPLFVDSVGRDRGILYSVVALLLIARYEFRIICERLRYAWTTCLEDLQSMQRRSGGFQKCVPRSLIFARLTKEVEETYSDASLSAGQQSCLRTIEDGCRGVLEDLRRLLDKYNSLGTNSQRTCPKSLLEKNSTRF